MRKDIRIAPVREKGKSRMIKEIMKPRRIICVSLMILIVTGLVFAGVVPGTVQPAEAQFGEVILAIQVTLGAVKLVGDLFSLAKYFLGPNPSAEALEMLEDQTKELEDIISQEDVILNDITQITDKLAQNALTETANAGIANIEARYGEMLQMAQLGYGNVPDSTMSIFSDNVMGPLNSIERCVEAFYQSLVIHPPGSPNCALEQARDVALDELAGVTSSSDFSATVESTNGVNIVAERPMYFNYDNAMSGGSCQAGITKPGRTFYFAEGTVRPNFHSFLCIQNPSGKEARVKITYMQGDGTTREQTLTLGGKGRGTVNVNDFLGQLDGPSADFSAKVESTNGVDIVAERPMYFNYNGIWTGGHVNAGITAPVTKMHFAEGSTRPGFDSFLCLQNPDTREADILITYMKGDGSNQQQSVKVPARTRHTVRVSDAIGQFDGEACDFSATVESTNGVGLVAERPMYFTYAGKWTGGHCQNGAAEPSGQHLFAEGTTRPGFDSFLCLQNPGGEDSNVLITYMKGDGSNQQQPVTIPARTRKTIRVSDAIGQFDGEACDFSAQLEVKSGPAILAERPMYFDFGGRWNGGHDEASITSSGTKFHFAEGTRRPNFSTYLCIQNPEDKTAEVQITYMKGDGKSQVQRLSVPARSRRTVSCSESVTGPSLKDVFEANLMKLFASAWVYQMMGSQCVIFARDYKPGKYGTSDDYRNSYYERYMQEEAEMFLQCTEQLVMSQVDVSSTSRSQAGVFNLPTDAAAVLSQADELARMALAEGTTTQDPDGSYSKVNLGLCGRLIASRDILPAGGTPQQLRAKVHGGSTTYNADKTQLVSIPWESVNKTALLYDCWTGAAPYNTVSLEDNWSFVRYRFDNLPAGDYDIIDSGGNVLSTGTVTTQQATSSDETYQLTYGSFKPIVTTRGGPAILLNSSQWTGSKSTSGTLRNMEDPRYYHTVIDPAAGAAGVWMYSSGGDHGTTFTCDQDTFLERTITAGADITVYPHYALSPKQVTADGDARGSVSGNITILPTHYKATASWELYVTDLTTSTKTTIATDTISAEDNAGKYDNSDKFDYDSRTDLTDAYYVPYNMTSGHQYKFTLKLYAHHYTDIHDNSNMWAKVNQQIVLDGLRLLGF